MGGLASVLFDAHCQIAGDESGKKHQKSCGVAGIISVQRKTGLRKKEIEN